MRRAGQIDSGATQPKSPKMSTHPVWRQLWSKVEPKPCRRTSEVGGDSIVLANLPAPPGRAIAPVRSCTIMAGHSGRGWTTRRRPVGKERSDDRRAARMGSGPTRATVQMEECRS